MVALHSAEACPLNKRVNKHFRSGWGRAVGVCKREHWEVWLGSSHGQIGIQTQGHIISPQRTQSGKARGYRCPGKQTVDNLQLQNFHLDPRDKSVALQWGLRRRLMSEHTPEGDHCLVRHNSTGKCKRTARQQHPGSNLPLKGAVFCKVVNALSLHLSLFQKFPMKEQMQTMNQCSYFLKKLKREFDVIYKTLKTQF